MPPRSWPALGSWNGKTWAGQLVPLEKVEALLSKVKSGEVNGWDEVHAEYARLWSEYPLEKAQHAWATLCDLLEATELQEAQFLKEVERFADTSRFIEEQVYLTRRKDYANPFRKATFRGDEEMKAVLGTPESASFIRYAKAEMERWRARADALLGRLGTQEG
jgi:hypothetical protein